MLLGADTDEMRDVQQDCLKTAQTADQAIVFLTLLVAILKAASVWTGGSSLAYASYLEGTVIPWLKKISMALKLFAQVLGANAQAQDDVSAGTSVDFSALPRYTSPQLPSASTTNAPVMTFPQGAGTRVEGGAVEVPAGASVDGTTTSVPAGPTGSAPVGSTYGDDSGGTVAGGATGTAGGAVGPTASGTYSGSGSGALGGGVGSSGGGGSTASGGTGETYGSGTSAGGALGTGGSTPTATYTGDTTPYDGSSGGALTGTTPSVSDGGADGAGSDAGTYAAAGAAGALGLGGAAALAGRDVGGLGKGFSSATGFDYHRIKGVKDNPNVTAEFLRRTEQIATRLGCKPEELMAVMSFETGGSFSPAQRNLAGGGARGLIQFMPDTARGLGTSSAELVRMTPVQQLDYVEKYFGNGRYTTVEGLYSKVLAGRAVNDENGVLFRAGTREYRANRGVDIDRNGIITAGEAAAKVRAHILPGG